jgi:hypothetical protein
MRYGVLQIDAGGAWWRPPGAAAPVWVAFPSPTDDAGREDWVALFQSLPRGRAKSGARVTVVLPPPLAETRLLALPALTDDEAVHVVRRGAARFMPDIRYAVLVAVERAGRRSTTRIAVAVADALAGELDLAARARRRHDAAGGRARGAGR